MIASCFINGNIVPVHKAVIAINDLGLLRGYAIFDFCRTVGGKPFLLEHHLVRFRNSARLMALDLPYSNQEMTEAVQQTLQVSGLAEAGIRLLLTGGYTPDSFTVAEPTLIITIEPISTVPAQLLHTGVKLMSYAHQREMPEVKTTNYITALRLRDEQQEQQAYDILYHAQGNILELTRSNFFLVKDKKVITPASSILKGITRKIVLELASRQYQVEEREVKWSELQEADEAFLTGTNKKLVPVTQVDEIHIGNGQPGPITAKLYKDFLNFEQAYKPAYQTI